MSRGVKNEESKILELLKNVKQIVKKMQLEFEIGEELASMLLPKLVKFNMSNLQIEDEKRQIRNTKAYKKVYNMLLNYLLFTEDENETIRVTLNKEAFLKDSFITADIRSVIKGVEELKSVEKLLNDIDNQRRFFNENKKVLKKIRSRNIHVELEELLDNVGSLTFENECSLTRFLKLLNLKIKDLEKLESV